MPGDRFEVRDHVSEVARLSAASGGFDQVQQGRPAHEAMERRVALVENGPQVLESVPVPPIADSCGAARKVCGREQRPTLHGKQRSLWFGKNRFEVWLGSAQGGRQTADQICGEPVLSLSCVPREAGCLVCCRGGSRPLAGVDRGPRVVHESLRQRHPPHLLTEAVDRGSQEPYSAREITGLLGGDPHIHGSDWVSHLVEM